MKTKPPDTGNNPLVDTHAHICDAEFDGNREQVLKRAQTAGVSASVAVSETLTDAQKNLTLAEAFPMIRPAAGLYPTHLDMEAADRMADEPSSSLRIQKPVSTQRA